MVAPARLDARPLAAASDWIGDYAKFWADSFDSLGSYLDRLQHNPETKPAKENDDV